MSGFFFAFIATLLAGMGGRDQLLVARLSERLGQPLPVLFIALLTMAGTTAAAAWIGASMLQDLKGPARPIFTGLALLVGGLETLWLGRGRLPVEPTRSLVAIAIVLIATQATDAARFLVLAFAINSEAPIAAALGGMTSGVLILVLGWALPAVAAWPALSRLRTLAAWLLTATGAIMVLRNIF